MFVPSRKLARFPPPTTTSTRLTSTSLRRRLPRVTTNKVVIVTEPQFDAESHRLRAFKHIRTPLASVSPPPTIRRDPAQTVSQLQLLPATLPTAYRGISSLSRSNFRTPSGFVAQRRFSTSATAVMSKLSTAPVPEESENPLREHSRRPVERLADHLEKPSLDDRTYRVIRLPNQLEVLLVHDVETDKASAAMDVNVGNFSDFEDLPGVAHAVEHLLFMGTKKYPVENAYSSYLSAHSGTSNAYTAATSTNYYFEVAASPVEGADPAELGTSPLYGALDRFAQFFIDPLFLDSTLDRELKAVDSENKKNLQSDLWRLHQLDKALSNPNHPFCHFSTGNFEVLKTIPESKGVNVRDKFMEFHAKYYSANRMKLVILGKESLDTLEEWAADLFAGVRNKNLPQNRWETETPYGPNELLTQCFAKPVMDSRSLELSFPILDEEHMFKSAPSHYLSHLIGHEGPGSIMSYIKSKGWANNLSAGGFTVCPGTPGIFSCQIRLTEDGLKNYKEVIKVVFQYISLLRETPPQEWIFEEQKGLAEVAFKFKQKTPASRFTSQISAVMQTPLPREWLLSGQNVLREYDPARIEECLACLRPDNFRISVVSQNFPGDWDQKEHWYGTEYKHEKIPADFLEEIKQAAHTTTKDRIPELHLPRQNQFIPENLDVEKKEVDVPAISPKLIRHDDLVRTWYKKDDTFWVPKANVFINLRTPLTTASAESAIKSTLYAELVRDALEEYSYDADLAGLGFTVSSTSSGLDLNVGGYSDKLVVLLEKVLITARDLVVKDDRFEIIKERLARGLKNAEFQQPYNQVGGYTEWLNSERGFINQQYALEVPHLTAADIREFYPTLLRQIHIEILAHGNLYKEDVLKITDTVENILKPRALPKIQWPIARKLIYPPGSNYIFEQTLKDPKNINHCIEYLLTIGDKSDRALKVKVMLLDQMTQEPAFNQLRTKEQLGYVVFSGVRPTSTTVGYRFIIQSEKCPAYLEERIDSFLTGYTKTLREMSDVDFEAHKNSLITKKLEKLKNLDQESSRLWAHVEKEVYDFDLARNDVAAIKVLTKADMIEFYDHFIHPISPHRAKLAVYLIAQSEAPVEEPSKIEELVGKAKGLVLGEKGEEKKAEEEEEAINYEKVPGNGTTPIYIKDVREFKATLQVTAGPRAIRHVSEFEEGEAKL